MDQIKLKIASFSTKSFDQEYLEKSLANSTNATKIKIDYFPFHLNNKTVNLTKGYDGIIIFVNDTCNHEVVEELSKNGVKLVLLRCAGFNNVDLVGCKERNIAVLRVPQYSPYAVAEHAVGLLLTLNRKYHKIYNRVREQNFSLEGLMGFDIHGKTIGVIGTGAIGAIFARIMSSFGAKMLAYDVFENKDLKEQNVVEYTTLDEVYKRSDIISLHVPLFPTTHHMVNEESLNKMKDGVIIINTSRGALIDTEAVINALKKNKIGGLGMDVYEQESDFFFENLSDKVIQDDVLIRLIHFNNVILTPHSAYFTETVIFFSFYFSFFLTLLIMLQSFWEVLLCKVKMS
eukprot:TRINITY_DN2240_c0_g1_i2.p1 TRINITY_DN2240_c0_g1~~TRINITY_DN2240_c0_g1_i2.p1  ORF type:complete len:345 (+),score=86.69 TRINITY_DN2240_c0_g1_i2:25-1059(+)